VRSRLEAGAPLGCPPLPGGGADLEAIRFAAPALFRKCAPVPPTLETRAGDGRKKRVLGVDSELNRGVIVTSRAGGDLLDAGLSDLSDTQRATVLAHELGHALGLNAREYMVTSEGHFPRPPIKYPPYDGVQLFHADTKESLMYCEESAAGLGISWYETKRVADVDRNGTK